MDVTIGDKVYYMSVRGKLTAGTVIERSPSGWLVVKTRTGLEWNCRPYNVFHRDDAGRILREIKRRQKRMENG